MKKVREKEEIMKENVIKEENMRGKREYRKIKMGTMH